MDYIAYLVRVYLPFVFPLVVLLARLVASLKYGRKLVTARRQAYINGVVSGQSSEMRPLTLNDVDAFLAFIDTLPEEHLTFFKPHGFDEKSVKKVLKSRAFSPYGLFVDGQLLGYALLKVSPTGRAFLGRLVSPALTGMGLGSFMARYLYWQAGLAGLKPTSTISRNNIPSLKSHSAVAEYKVVRELPNDFLLIEFLSSPTEAPLLEVVDGSGNRHV